MTAKDSTSDGWQSSDGGPSGAIAGVGCLSRVEVVPTGRSRMAGKRRMWSEMMVEVHCCPSSLALTETEVVLAAARAEVGKEGRAGCLADHEDPRQVTVADNEVQGQCVTTVAQGDRLWLLLYLWSDPQLQC